MPPFQFGQNFWFAKFQNQLFVIFLFPCFDVIQFCYKKYNYYQATQDNRKYFQHSFKMILKFFMLITILRSVNKLRFHQHSFILNIGPPAETLVTVRKLTFGRLYKLIDLFSAPILEFSRLHKLLLLK